MKERHYWTDEQLQFLRKQYPKLSKRELLTKVNARFNLDVKINQLVACLKNHKITSGRNGQFVKGQQSWNKGMKGLQLGGQAGWFKKGNIPPSHKPVGSESMHDGSVWLKVEEPNVWRRKHIWLWEQHHGKIPDDCFVHFKDGDRLNVTMENLFLVPKRVFTSVMKRELQSDDPELNLAIHKVTELDFKIRDYEVEFNE